MELTRLLLECSGALLLAIATFFLYTVANSLKDLRKDVSGLREELAKDYVRQEDFRIARQRLHDFGNKIAALEATEYLRGKR